MSFTMNLIDIFHHKNGQIPKQLDELHWKITRFIFMEKRRAFEIEKLNIDKIDGIQLCNEYVVPHEFYFTWHYSL